MTSKSKAKTTTFIKYNGDPRCYDHTNTRNEIVYEKNAQVAPPIINQMRNETTSVDGDGTFEETNNFLC